MAIRPTRILVPIDFSETASAALDYAIFLAKTFGARVELLHVIDPLTHVAGESIYVGSDRTETVREYGQRIAAEQLGRMSEKLQKENIDVRVTVEEGVPWERIVSAAERADLVVMGTHGRTGLTRVFLGSVTDKVVQRSLMPVLTIRGAITEPARAPAPSKFSLAGTPGAG